MNIHAVFDLFCQAVKLRTELMTEDNIRYYWLASMLQQDNDLNNYTLEQPYGVLPRKELDLMYSNQNEAFLFEIKFHRHNSDSSFAHTMAAGEIFDDIQRLALFPSKCKKMIRRFFLYVTDSEMDRYFDGRTIKNNPYRTELKSFYRGQKRSLNIGKDVAPKTFIKEAYCSVPNKKNAISINNIGLIEKDDFSNVLSESFQDREGHVRLYELK